VIGNIQEVLKTKQRIVSVESKQGEVYEGLPSCRNNKFKAFDKVLVRNYDEEKWFATFYSSYNPNTQHHLCTDGKYYKFCVPFNKYKHLNNRCGEAVISDKKILSVNKTKLKKGQHMKRFDYIIKDKIGIHARPAGMLAKAAKEFRSEIFIEKNGKRVSLAKLMQVMSLGVKCGDTVGYIGESSMVEIAQEPHLHFEAQLNGKYVNPEDYLSSEAKASLLQDTSYEN
jgi:phosphocarrier protein